MKNLLKIASAILLALTIARPAQSQNLPPTGTVVEASDFSGWTAISNNQVTGTTSFTVRGNGFFASTNGINFTPFATTTALNIEAAGGTAETVTPSAVSCTQNSVENTCTITATFSFTHNAGFRVTSGDFGLDEAVRSVPSGTLVFVRKSIVSVVTSSVSSITLTNMIPANVILDAVVTKSLVAFTGSTGYKVGDGVTTDLWGTNASNSKSFGPADYKVAYGAIGNQTAQVGAALGFVPSATNIVLTALVANFTAGTVKTTVTYHAVAN